MGFFCVDDLSGENEFQGAALPNKARESLRSAGAGDYSQSNFRLAKLCIFGGDPNRASHRRFATAAKCKTIDGCYHWLAQIFNEVQRSLSVPRKIFRL